MRQFLALLIVGCLGLYSGDVGAASNVPAMAGPSEQADKIVVYKSIRRMELWRGEGLLRQYRIALGANPVGHKQQQGDERTPEGDYVIDWRNPNSIAHLSLHISYPNAQDRARAAAAGVSPGGDIMIHGVANGWERYGWILRFFDWTDGCIAVTNSQMREIWTLVPNGTPITILP